MKISESFKRFWYINFNSNFMESKSLFQKAGVLFFSWNHWDWKHIIFIQNCCQKPMLRQIECRLQNGTIIRSAVLPITALFFWKICFSFSTSYNELIWCTNDPDVHIRIFRRCWSFILGCFFPESILRPTLRNGTFLVHAW